MKRKIVLRLSFLAVLLTFLWSCRNEDLAQADKNPQRNNADFFAHSKNRGANARAGVDYIDLLEAYNKEKDFLAQMPDQKGMPIWEKMQVFDGGTATALIIPLSDDNEVLSSLLFATVDSKMQVLGVRNFDNALLREIVYDETISRDYREYLFSTFMMADHYTFGTTHFTNIPKDLFVKQKYNDDLGRISIKDISFSNVTSNENGRILIIKTCYIVLHCTHHGTGACDAIDGCTDCGTEYCTYSVVTTSGAGIPSTNTDPGGISSPGTGSDGGGSGTPAVIPDPDPCGMTKAFYRLAPGCSGNNDAPEPLQNPCEKIKAQRNSDFNDKITDLKSKTNLKKETGYIQKIDNSYTYNDNAAATDTNNALGLPTASLPGNKDIKGYMHTHVNNFIYYDNNAQMDMEKIGIKIFSPADVSYLMEMLTNAQETLTPLDDVYAVMVSSDQTYQIRFTGNQYQIKTFTKQQKEIFRNLYLKFMKNRSKNNSKLEFGFLKFIDETMNVKGVALYRMNSNGTTTEIKLNATKTDIVTADCSN